MSTQEIFNGVSAFIFAYFAIKMLKTNDRNEIISLMVNGCIAFVVMAIVWGFVLMT